MSRLLRRDVMNLTAAGVAVATFDPAMFATPRPRVPGPRTELRRYLGSPAFFLDGQPYTKPVFETYVPEPRALACEIRSVQLESLLREILVGFDLRREASAADVELHRVHQGRPVATLSVTLVESSLQDEASYTLEGHGHGFPTQKGAFGEGTGLKTRDISAPEEFW